MSSRTVCLVLIAAVIACPLWCGNGLCRAGQCCPQGESQSSDVCPVHQTRICCCNPASQDSQGDDQPCPTRSSETFCQGICGGAVFEKTVDVNKVARVLFLPLSDAQTPTVFRLCEHGHDRNGQHQCVSRVNHGRFVRTLHMSFLC